MFEKQKPRYPTRGVHEMIPLQLQIFMWNAVDNMPQPKDYFQIFQLSVENGLQVIHHNAEQPEYNMTYILSESDTHITAKIYVIDSEAAAPNGTTH